MLDVNVIDAFELRLISSNGGGEGMCQHFIVNQGIIICIKQQNRSFTSCLRDCEFFSLATDRSPDFCNQMLSHLLSGSRHNLNYERYTEAFTLRNENRKSRTWKFKSFTRARVVSFGRALYGID